MKKKFIGFYNPTSREVDEAWNNGFFAFDANTLLNLYRYTDNTRKDFLGALQTIKGRLFLPYQAAYEYHNNRLEVIEGIEKAYENLYNIFLKNFDENIKSQINQYKKHPSILIDSIEKLYSKFLEGLQKELNNQKTKHPDFKINDDVLEEISNLFDDNSVGEELSKEQLQKIYQEGQDRYSNEIPPGYRDLPNKQKKGQRHVYGDLIVWKELLNFTKNKKQPLIFITDDLKDDWWTIQKGKTIRPREELIKEFYDFTDIRILIYNADNFLSFAKKKGFLPKLKEETIEEVKNIRASDEKYYTNLKSIINTLTSKSESDVLRNQIYQSINLSDILSTQKVASKTFSELLNTQTYQPINLSDILSTQKIASKTLSELLNTQTYQPINLSDILSTQKVASKTLSEKVEKTKETIPSIKDNSKDDSNKKTK